MVTLLGREAWYDGYPVATPNLGAPMLLGFGQNAVAPAPRVNWAALWPKVAGVLALASASASAYHGYKRNQSIGWAIWWFAMGTLFPVVTPVIGVAQGFGKRKG